MHPSSIVLAVAAVFFVSDLVYALDHYFVHHDPERYRATHARHHRRYNAPRKGPQLDSYELSTYASAALMSVAATSVLTLFSGNPGFVLGAALKFAHTLLFHLYQHRWWSAAPLRRHRPEPPRRTWGLASASYHAFHHSDPNDAVFTYAESWAGFDRIFERIHPWLFRFTVEGRQRSGATAAGDPIGGRR